MAHYAKLDDNNIVTQVNVVDEEFFKANPERYQGRWIQTSYNTRGGIHITGGVPLRKNFASLGYTYDEERDAFIAPKPFSKWVLNEDTCRWEAPIPKPCDDKFYIWNNNQGNWEELNN